ncbi:MAG: sialidase family protein [Wenzhouxiangellaceae bacterium]|nr:sialidase family protein [Wenzhouxiangellaceae bacterium]
MFSVHRTAVSPFPLPAAFLLPALLLPTIASPAAPAPEPMQPTPLIDVATPAAPGSLAPGFAVDSFNNTIVMSWLEQVPGGHALRFARFDSESFGPVREIARGEDWFANWADTPAVRIGDNGVWLAHWLEKSADATYAYDIRLARSSDGGRTWTAATTPHDDGTPTEHGFVSYFPAAAGAGMTDPDAVGMAWLDGRRTGRGGPMTLRTATVRADGTIESPEVLDERVCDCCRTAGAGTALGPVVVFRDRTEDRDGNEIRDISIVRRTDAGWSDPVPVHRDGWNIAGCPVNGPDVIANGMKVVVAWFTMAGGVPRVRLALSDDAGATFEAPVTLSEGSALGRVRLAWLNGGFALAWMDQPDGSRALMRLARFDARGEKRDERVLGELSAGRISGFPQIAVAANDRLLVAWTGTERASDGSAAPRVRTGLLQFAD